jgi:hypothetical protein
MLSGSNNGNDAKGGGRKSEATSNGRSGEKISFFPPRQLLNLNIFSI